MEKLYDLVIKNARVVRPNKTSVDCLDIAVKQGKVARLAPDIQSEQAEAVFDAKNRLAFPGCVDAHMHIGIYAPLAQDAVSESINGPATEAARDKQEKLKERFKQWIWQDDERRERLVRKYNDEFNHP